MPKRQGNNPKRRIAPRHEVDSGVLTRLADEARYTGSALHKRRGADYGFVPPASPRPDKSLCDGGRSVRVDEARTLFLEGIRRGMISTHCEGGLPKYVWAVATDGRVYEAKLARGTRNYHGYELGSDERAMRSWVIDEWSERCPAE